MNKSWTDRWRSAKLSPSARHDPFQRHVGSNQRAKKSWAVEEREGEGFTLKYVDPRAILGLFSLHPAGCSGRIPVRHAGRESVYRMIQKHRIIFLSLSGLERAASPASFLLFSSARRPRACDHHYARPPSLVPISPSFSFSSSSATSFLPSSCSLPISPLRYLLPQITYPLNESRRKRCLPATV